MNIKLNIPRTVTIPQNYIYEFTDNPSNKTVSVLIIGPAVRLTIWEGKDYDAAGDYTQEQLNEAVAAKINSLKVS